MYSWLIRAFCLPFGSFVPLIALQALMGAAVAWLLAFALIRFFNVRWQIAAAAALAFAWDPTQVVSEHLVMTETSAGFAAAVFILVVLEYLRQPRNIWLPVLALLGALLVSLRLVYIPLVYACAVLIPVFAIAILAGDRPRRFAVALGLSVTTVIACQFGYQWMTGILAHREPGYQYRSGFFLAGDLAPLLDERDANDPRTAAVVREMKSGGHPLSDDSSEARGYQLWNPNGFVSRLTRAYDGDIIRAAEEARVLALRGVRRSPIHFITLGIRSWSEYPVFLRKEAFAVMTKIDDGADPNTQPREVAWQAITAHFSQPGRDQASDRTLSRRYHWRLGRPWCWMQYFAPFLGLAATWAAYPGSRRAAGFLALWGAMVLAVTCLTTQTEIRYLHPLSFPALAAIAILGERLLHSIFDDRGASAGINLEVKQYSGW